MKILFADPDVKFTAEIKQLVEAYPNTRFQVLFATSNVEAMTLLRKNRDINGIFINPVMPDGNGFDVLLEAKIRHSPRMRKVIHVKHPHPGLEEALPLVNARGILVGRAEIVNALFKTGICKQAKKELVEK